MVARPNVIFGDNTKNFLDSDLLAAALRSNREVAPARRTRLHVDDSRLQDDVDVTWFGLPQPTCYVITCMPMTSSTSSTTSARVDGNTGFDKSTSSGTQKPASHKYVSST
jgi:hypothetical protein